MGNHPANVQTKRIVVIGGGASGVLVTAHLLRDPSPDLRVTLIEKRENVGLGLAYGTANPNHLLNVRAANMSAFADEPNHFWNWLVAHGEAETTSCSDPFCFVPRRVYGRYLGSLIERHLANPSRPGRLNVVHGEVVAIADRQSGIAVTLADGSTHVGHKAVLATGHDVFTVLPQSCSADPWNESLFAGLDRDGAIVIVGTGLTMVDCVLSLLDNGHRGPIYALSRRGLLPRVHRHTEPVRLDAADVPLGTELAYLWRWFRGFVRWHVERGGDWRGAVDGVRPYTQLIWQNLPLDAKRRFLVHARAWWDVHRHRMAPEVDSRLRAAIGRGQLQVIAAKIAHIAPNDTGALVQFHRRGEPVAETLQAARVIECTGIVTDPLATPNPLLRDLFAKGLCRPDPLGIGLDVTDECAVIDAKGRPSPRIFAAGPLTRAAFWEIVAVPDIRLQCADLARRLTRSELAA